MNNMPRNFPHTIKLSDDQQETLDRLKRLREDMRGQIHTTTTDTASVMHGHDAATCLHYADAEGDGLYYTPPNVVDFMQGSLHQDDAQGLIPDNEVILPRYKPEAEDVSPHCLTLMAESGTLRDAPKRHVQSEMDDESGRVGNLVGNVIIGGAVSAFGVGLLCMIVAACWH